MPIHFHTDPEQVHVEFLGGDLIVGLCGDDENGVDSVGVAEAIRPGKSGSEVEEGDAAAPSVFLRFQTTGSIDTLIRTLKDYREQRFGSRGDE